ncbi:MAG: CHAT domain-containing protein [Gammaproteobacteria bacterium]
MGAVQAFRRGGWGNRGWALPLRGIRRCALAARRALKSPLKLTNMALVVPEDFGLAMASVERDAILALADGDRKVTPILAGFLELQTALASGQYDGWHFSGHGIHRTPDPNKASILLGKGQQFTPDNLAGEIRRLGRTRPFVFLNACQTGRGGLSLTGVVGWAREFLTSGAGALVGTYWSVFDQPACHFASALYAHLLSGEPIGKAVQCARAAIRTAGDPTWLAYAVFAHPMARLETT